MTLAIKKNNEVVSAADNASQPIVDSRYVLIGRLGLPGESGINPDTGYRGGKSAVLQLHGPLYLFQKQPEYADSSRTKTYSTITYATSDPQDLAAELVYAVAKIAPERALQLKPLVAKLQQESLGTYSTDIEQNKMVPVPQNSCGFIG
jgi:hypothetical protein